MPANFPQSETDAPVQKRKRKKKGQEKNIVCRPLTFSFYTRLFTYPSSKYFFLSTLLLTLLTPLTILHEIVFYSLLIDTIFITFTSFCSRLSFLSTPYPNSSPNLTIAYIPPTFFRFHLHAIKLLFKHQVSTKTCPAL